MSAADAADVAVGAEPVRVGWPAPVTDDHDSAGFWEAAARHRLVARVCAACGTTLHLPRARCVRCGSFDGSWEPRSGAGRLYSYTTVTHQVHPAFPVPYTVVLVELADDPAVRLVGTLDGAPPLTIGMPMHVTWEARGNGTVVPNWAPDEAHGGASA